MSRAEFPADFHYTESPVPSLNMTTLSIPIGTVRSGKGNIKYITSYLFLTFTRDFARVVLLTDLANKEFSRGNELFLWDTNLSSYLCRITSIHCSLQRAENNNKQIYTLAFVYTYLFRIRQFYRYPFAQRNDISLLHAGWFHK